MEMILFWKKKFFNYIYVDLRKPGHYSYEGLNISFLYEPFYVGKGKDKRWKSKHRNPYVKNIVNILGDPINFTILINICTDEKFVLFEEIRIISLIGKSSNGGPLRNFTDGGEGTSGHVQSEEHRQKNRKSHLGRKHTKESKKLIGNSSRGEKHYRFGKHCSQEIINRIKETKSKRIYQISFPSGEIKIIKNLNEFCKENNLNHSNMYQVLKGKVCHCKGYKVKYYDPESTDTD
jgi:hypothetical protein